jgi:hypothetical protein
VHAATLPGGIQNLGDGGLQPFMRIRDKQLDPTQITAGEAAQELGQKGSPSLLPMAMPSTSRRPSVLTATATITATETM